jgi:hypothetical protein
MAIDTTPTLTLVTMLSVMAMINAPREIHARFIDSP